MTRNVTDQRVAALFAQLHDEVTADKRRELTRRRESTMRPIVMDMHGFASFREQTRVDLTDADFFALAGPIGAGKSTVIDAMTFARYGSVPRWGRKGMVSLALAPTVARATVTSRLP